MKTTMIDKKEFFINVTTGICSSIHLDTALFNTLKYIKNYIPVEEIYMGLFDYHKMVFRKIAFASNEGGHILESSVPISEKGRHAVSIFDINKVTIFASATEDPLIYEVFSDISIPVPEKPCIVLPLVAGSHLVGVTHFFSAGKDQYFTKEYADLISSVSRPMSIALSNCLEHLELEKLQKRTDDENKRLKKQITDMTKTDFIGKDTGLKDVYNLAQVVAPLNSPVLITGETGTGKEVIASKIHELSARSDGPFVKVNCGAIPESLIDSELFGHEKGAFTGALERKAGRFERADGGTIFLDEIGELPLNAQVRLLRVLQEKEIERVGGSNTIKIDIRIICATNKNLLKMVQNGEFREDLFFRINVFPITIPPLRCRREDIPELANFFILKKCAEMSISHIPFINDEDMLTLINYNWPGNVREFQNIIERAIILRKNNMLNFDSTDLKPHNANHQNAYPEQSYISSNNTKDIIMPHDKHNTAIKTLDDEMRSVILKALSATNGRVSGPKGAASLLGINPSTLRNRMIKLGIKAK